jgi:hypothetical protein
MRRLLLVALGLALSAGCTTTVDPAKRGQKNLGTAVAAPFKDLGLVKPEAPKQLSDITYPYDPARLENGCAQVAYEIGALDRLLGPESYAPAPDKSMGDKAKSATGNAVGGAAEGATTGFIPFRGVVREVSGASKAEAEVNHAIAMGQLRRAFLRGFGLAVGCQGVLAPGGPAPRPYTQPQVKGVGAPP